MKLLKLFLWSGFVLYIALLIQVILIKDLPVSFLVQNLELGINAYQTNFVPFSTIKNYFLYASFYNSTLNLAGNIIIFMPLGFLLPILIRRFQKIGIIFLLSFGISLIFEITQLMFPVLGGTFDVDDLILNTFGALLGYIIFVLIQKVIQKVVI